MWFQVCAQQFFSDPALVKHLVRSRNHLVLCAATLSAGVRFAKVVQGVWCAQLHASTRAYRGNAIPMKTV
jgi:hypothetical protein